MHKYMFDTNMFDKALYSGKANIIGKRNDIQICISATQAEEIANIPDSSVYDPNSKEKRIRLIITMLQLNVRLVLNAAVVEYGRLGTCVLGNEEIDNVLNRIYSKMPKSRSISDCIIAEASIREGCTLVTEDKDLLKAMAAFEYPAINWNDFEKKVGIV